MPEPPPSAFAVVMATGIVSAAAAGIGERTLSRASIALAAALYVVLVALVGRRPHAVRRALSHPASAFGVLTFTAAGDLLADRAGALGWTVPAGVLWIFDGLVWALVLVEAARAIAADGTGAATGQWLLAVVATQSLALVATRLEPRVARPLGPLALALLLLGISLYPPVLAAAARCLFELPLRASSWIGSGALSISALASARASELAAVPGHGGLAELGLALWCVASLWLPPLAVAELTSLHRRGYDRSRWSAVFPLGMYAAAAEALSSATGIHGLHEVGVVAFWVALAAWLATAAAALAGARWAARP